MELFLRGWFAIAILVLLYTLSHYTHLMPVELGFSGSAAIFLAAYFILRDLFGLGHTGYQTKRPKKRWPHGEFMNRALPLTLASIIMIIIADPSFGTSFTTGYAKPFFDRVAVFGIVVSAFMVFLGYRLLVAGTKQRSRGRLRSLTVGFSSFGILLYRTAPGVIFTALGCVGLFASLLHFSE
jgi:hypothetical protein